jgi:hypothetical protein
MFQGRMRALPLLGQRPAPAVANEFDKSIEGFIKIHLAGFDQGKTRRRAGEEDEPGINQFVGHDTPSACAMASIARPRGLAASPFGLHASVLGAGPWLDYQSTLLCVRASRRWRGKQNWASR